MTGVALVGSRLPRHLAVTRWRLAGGCNFCQGFTSRSLLSAEVLHNCVRRVRDCKPSIFANLLNRSSSHSLNTSFGRKNLYWAQSERSSSSVSSCLTGVKVLDLSRILAGPSAAQLLGDLGADVIKIEEPTRGDDTRSFKTPIEHQEPGTYQPQMSNYFISCNRNKRSMTLNLKSPQGIEILKKLVARSDVLIENFITGKMEELGVGYDTLSKINPRLVYSRVTGFGSTGPLAKAAGYDVIAAAKSGLMSITGERDRTPVKTGVALCDIITGLHATVGILSSLYDRDRKGANGSGQLVDVSLFESSLSVLFNIGSSYLNSDEDGERWGTQHPAIVPYQAFQAKNGYLIIGATNDRQFQKLCDALELQKLKYDSRFKTNDDRVRNRNELIEILSDRLKTDSSESWVEKLTKLGLPSSRVNTIRQAFEEPQAHEREMIQEIENEFAKSGKSKLIGPPIKLSKSPATIRLPPPAFGHHTHEILSTLGYSDVEIKDLKKSGTI